MHTYLLTGVVLPERAQISFGHPFQIMFEQGPIDVTASVINNQVAVWVTSTWPWEAHTLRNTIASHLTHQLAVAGFLVGNAYDLELTRITSPDQSVDYVFGIDIPCITEKMQGKYSPEAYSRILDKTTGPLGMLLNRCFTDLTLAMKHPMDTAFYCYRAIEALRHHCGATHGIAEKTPQWERFRQVCAIDREQIDQIRIQADGVRHGQVVTITNDQRMQLLMRTWDIVEKYIDALPAPQAAR